MHHNQLLPVNFIYKYRNEINFVPDNVLFSDEDMENDPEYLAAKIKADTYILNNLYEHDVDRVLAGLYLFPYSTKKSVYKAYILNTLIKNNRVHIYKIVFVLESILDNSNDSFSNDFICYILHTINTNFYMNIKLDKHQFFWLLFIIYKLRDAYLLENNKTQIEFIQLLKNIYNKYFLHANFPLITNEYINYIIKDLLTIYNESADNEKQLICKHCKSIININNIDYDIYHKFLSTVYNMSNIKIKSKYLLKII